MRIRRFLLISIGIYLFINIGLFFFNPYSSAWHYQDHDPRPLTVESPGDSSIDVEKIEKTLNEIDLAYNAREPDDLEKTQHRE